MISAFSSTNSWNPMTASTPRGIFIGNDPNLTPYWIVRTEQGKIAIRLNRTNDWECHSHIVLAAEPLVHGRYLGLAGLEISKKFSGGALSYPATQGVLYHKGWCLFIKLKNDDGSFTKYQIAGITMDFSEVEKSYSAWDLCFGDEFSYNYGRISNYAMHLPRPNGYFRCDEHEHNMAIGWSD